MIRTALVASLAFVACSATAEEPRAGDASSPQSDAKAVEIARATLQAMGGREAWEATHVLGWTFFGERAHLWDKRTGDVIVFDGEKVAQVNVRTREGSAYVRGLPVTDAEAHATALAEARDAWVNDSYWLVMPYELLDRGVVLAYGGEARLPDGRAADKLVVTFREPDLAPQEKYDVYVARDTHLVEQWSIYARASDAEPRFTTPWADWRRYGAILLSGDRGGQRKLSDIAVFDEPPPQLVPVARP
jgi:hypothetical protein